MDSEKLKTASPKEWKLKNFQKEIFDHLIEMYIAKRGAALPDIIADIEKSILLKALDQFSGNLKDTAHFLGIKYSTLYNKMKKYNLEP